MTQFETRVDTLARESAPADDWTSWTGPGLCRECMADAAARCLRESQLRFLKRLRLNGPRDTGASRKMTSNQGALCKATVACPRLPRTLVRTPLESSSWSKARNS